MRNYETFFYEYTDSKGRPTVKAVTQYAGKSIAAFAKYMPSDVYDVELGKAIALKRLDYKIAMKRAASADRKAENMTAIVAAYKQEIAHLNKRIEELQCHASDCRVEAAEAEKEIINLIR